ncbi:GntR family transcriptional regulator [Paenibacillus sp. J31TS4]|uniref:GntR family transcriptional regulator n=1 Tax=Paenibacillus sp. J31TS4 TaxID=2807195 RepID=UPI001AFF3F87|nr:GntR family transcriptional regulator [Paenibacillus sp. J31TS4]GIP36999.1 GntR family transcriptional regulator [Paenibacillus sp. J31TS4]
MKEELGGKLQFELDLSQPLYEQVWNHVRSSVAKGVIGLGEKMPSVRELAQMLQINPNTVMRAYQELERDGLTETRRGQGTFITSDPIKVATVRESLAQAAVEEFLARMDGLGFTVRDVMQMIRSKGGNGE